MNKKEFFSWALFDFADSAFSSIIQTFVFAVYFTKVVAVNEVEGSAQWGFVNALGAFIVAVLGPILGSIADQTGNRKLWIGLFSYLSIISTALLWFVLPGKAFLGMVLVCLGIVGSECSFIFYSAQLCHVAGEKNIGKWSGWGWGMGYAGGMLCLMVAFVVLVNPTTRLFSLNDVTYEPIRATFLLCALWYFIFSLPLFLWTHDEVRKPKRLLVGVSAGFVQMGQFLKHISSQKNIFQFLVARIFFIDGLTTLFAFGGVYAATVFKMDEGQILGFGILMHLTAGLGAFIFGAVDDRIGSKNLMIISLLFLMALCGGILFIKDPLIFWILGGFIGIFVGPVQSASRSYMAKMIEPTIQNQMFGLFAFSGKATAFLGPLLVGWLIYLTGSQRVGMSIIPLFFIIGLLFTIPVKKDIIR